MVLKSYIRTPEPILANTFPIGLPDVPIWLEVHLVPIEGIRDRSNITRMSDG